MVNPDNCFQKELLAQTPGSSVRSCREHRLPLNIDEHSTQRASQLQHFPRAERSQARFKPHLHFSPISIFLTPIISFLWSQVNILLKSVLLTKNCEIHLSQNTDPNLSTLNRNLTKMCSGINPQFQDHAHAQWQFNVSQGLRPKKNEEGIRTGRK